jgi:hypothetical protein
MAKPARVRTAAIAPYARTAGRRPARTRAANIVALVAAEVTMVAVTAATGAAVVVDTWAAANIGARMMAPVRALLAPTDRHIHFKGIQSE